MQKKAGVSPNSVFRYFDNKAELVQCTQIILWQEIIDHLLLTSKEELAKTENGLQEIRVLLSNFKELYENYSNYLLFSYDYKLFLVCNHIVLSEEQHNKIMNPIYLPFTSALERGHIDGSVTTAETVTTQFLTLWGVMRSFVEEIVVYDRMYSGLNPWKSHFDVVVYYILEALRKSNLKMEGGS